MKDRPYKVYFRGNNAGDHGTREAAEKRAARIVAMSNGRVKREEIDIRYEPKPQKNPSRASVIYARRKGNRGEFLWYDGRKFTTNSPPHYFGTRERAKGVARALIRKHHVLAGYNVYVGPPNAQLQRAAVRNPSWRTEAGLEAAAKRLEDFSGHTAKRVVRMQPRSNQHTGMIVGELDLIGYRAKRDGIGGGKLVRYEHDFGRGSRPLLAVSSDGKQLHIVGGRYEFTEAGIEDR